MICPMCGNKDSSVLETRRIDGKEEIMRRHKCKNKKCEYRFKTFEGYEAADVEAQFKVVEARKVLDKVIGWLTPTARRVPVVRDSLRQLQRARLCLEDREELPPEEGQEAPDPAFSN